MSPPLIGWHKYPTHVTKPILFESATNASAVFDPWSGKPVRGWTELHDRLDQILEMHGSELLVWRGVTDATWGLYSSLYRRLKKTKAKVEERDMLAAEFRILTKARRQWRFDQMSSLEILAHIQHYGGPTRLLDVTENPLIASWFAVEEARDEDGDLATDVDSRVFCFYVGENIGLDDWGGRKLRWQDWLTTKDRKDNDWGTGSVRRVWRPPAYNERISAQNGAFLLDGVPFAYPGFNQFTKAPGDSGSRWRIKEIRDVSSIPIKLNDSARAKQTERSTPAFTFRIDKRARKEIRERLEQNYGYSAGSLYSDLYGLAQYAAPELPR